MDTREFADTIGRQAIADAVGVWVTAVNNAVRRGKFPPAWFGILEDLAKGRSIECPRDLFGFLNSAAPSEGEGPLACSHKDGAAPESRQATQMDSPENRTPKTGEAA